MTAANNWSHVRIQGECFVLVGVRGVELGLSDDPQVHLSHWFSVSDEFCVHEREEEEKERWCVCVCVCMCGKKQLLTYHKTM